MILALAMVFALCACGQSSTPAAAPAGDAAASDAADKPTFSRSVITPLRTLSAVRWPRPSKSTLSLLPTEE